MDLKQDGSQNLIKTADRKFSFEEFILQRLIEKFSNGYGDTKIQKNQLYKFFGTFKLKKKQARDICRDLENQYDFVEFNPKFLKIKTEGKVNRK